MSSNETIIDFITCLAEVRRAFLKVQLFAERHQALHSVSIIVNPFKTKRSDSVNGDVTISIELDAELTNPLDADRKALGMSFLLRPSPDLCVVEAEVGWIG